MAAPRRKRRCLCGPAAFALILRRSSLATERRSVGGRGITGERATIDIEGRSDAVLTGEANLLRSVQRGVQGHLCRRPLEVRPADDLSILGVKPDAEVLPVSVAALLPESLPLEQCVRIGLFQIGRASCRERVCVPV